MTAAPACNCHTRLDGSQRNRDGEAPYKKKQKTSQENTHWFVYTARSPADVFGEGSRIPSCHSPTCANTIGSERSARFLKVSTKKCTNVYQAFRDDDAFGGNEWRDLTSDAPAENQRKDRTDARSRASGADISCCRTGSSRRAPLSELALERRCRKHRRKMIARSAEEDWALGCWTGVSVRFGKPETKTQR